MGNVRYLPAHRLATVVWWLALGQRLLAAAAGSGFPAEGLQIVAVIDGSDELHISQRSATWVHKSWAQPTDVRLNGFQWNPQQRPVLSNVLNPSLDLSGAVLHKLRGRGTVALGHDAQGLVISFDDPENGADTYEAELLFAPNLARSKSAFTNDLELHITADLNGTEEIWMARDEASWVHVGGSRPANVTVNGTTWDVVKHPRWSLHPQLLPEVLDLQRSSLTKLQGRGALKLDCRDGMLYLDFDDPSAGVGLYDLVVKVPPVGTRHLVRLKADVRDALLGAQLKIYRFPATEEILALLPGQRVFDATGQCVVALEAGQYQFEVQHQPGPQMLVVLKTGVLNISGPTNIDLKPRRIEPGLYGPDQRPFALDELLVRSSRPSGAVTWKAPAGAGTQPLALFLSEGQTYNIHAFGHAGTDYAALWRTVTAAECPRLALGNDQWSSCSFRWAEGTPPARANGVILQFPDGQQEIPDAEAARFLSNRRFFTVAYWLAFEGERKATFQPRGYVLPDSRSGEIVLGGPLKPQASAAVMEDENLKPPTAKHLWWEITLGDARGYLLDPANSKIDWSSTITTADGKPAVTAPLFSKDVQALGNLTDTLTVSASYRMDTPQHVSLHPERFASRQNERCYTEAPPYRDWNTRAYLTKMQRELTIITEIRQRPLPPELRFHIGWWLNHGAVGGNHSVTMAFDTYLNCLDWYTHPWAIAHEMLHSFGYGHNHEMNRLDWAVQERMEQFQWHVSDNPDHVPEGWSQPLQ
jgi:hypothetical protein